MPQRNTPPPRKFIGLAWLLLLVAIQPSAGLVSHYFSTRHCHHKHRHAVERIGAPLRLSASTSDNDKTSQASSHPPLNVTGVTLKVAFDTNWGVAEMANDAPSVRFTCDESLDMVHRLRRDSDAVLVGRGTVERDDCSLSVRRGVTVEKQPLRVVLDPRLSLVLAQVHEGTNYKLFTDGLPTVVYHCVPDVDVRSLNLLECVTLVYLPPADNNEGKLSISQTENTNNPRPGRFVSPRAVVDHLRDNFQVHHLMVEGGPQTANNFMQQEDGLIDRAIIVRAPISFQEPVPSNMSAQTLEEAGLELIGSSPSGVDTIDYWARPGLAWPTDPLGDWP